MIRSTLILTELEQVYCKGVLHQVVENKKRDL
jgi:hypothetical protein